MKYRRRSKNDGRRIKEDAGSAWSRVKARAKRNAEQRRAMSLSSLPDDRFDGGLHGIPKVARKVLCDEEGR